MIKKKYSLTDDKTNPYDDEMSLLNLISKLWEEKIIIFIISNVCMLLVYLFFSSLPKEFKTVVTTDDIPKEAFLFYEEKIFKLDSSSSKNEFYSIFNKKISSSANVQKFVEQSKEFDTFKASLQLKNINYGNYFNNKIGQRIEKNKIVPNEYFLIFTEELNGPIFLERYIDFTFNETQIEFNNNLKLRYKLRLQLFEEHLNYAKLLNLKNPILIKNSDQDLKNFEINQKQNLKPLTSSNNEDNFIVDIPGRDLFYLGSELLLLKIKTYSNILETIDRKRLNYKIILDKPSDPVSISRPLYLYTLVGLIFGLFLSLVIIFFKEQLKNK